MSTQILMPALSPTMEEGKLAKWHVKEGDAVKAGDILAEIETDKATMEFEAIDEGRIGKILVPEGAEGVKVNAPIAVLLGEGEASGTSAPAAPAQPAQSPQTIPAAMKAIREALTPGQKPETKKSLSPVVGEGAPQARKGAAAGPAKAPLPEAPKAPSTLSQGGAGKEKTNGARIFASPLAKRIAEMSGVDLNSLQGSGPRGRIIKADVEAAAKPGVAPRMAAPEQRAAAPATRAEALPTGLTPIPDARLFYKPDQYDEVPHDSLRKTIARRLASAKSLIPHYYLTVDCNVGELMLARSRLNARSTKEGPGAYKLSINDFVLKAAAMALMKHPDVNASWTETAMLRHKHADIGVAVDLNPGLITPIVFNAETKGLVEISNEVKSLAERAKAKKLKPSDYEGGGFSISNLGMFGMKQFTAVINPPQSAILAIGTGEERAVVKDGKIVPATIMTVTMGCDHRVVDGAVGARFLGTFKSFVEEPASMLL
jgi:pyruvate dehydrogenase E2 component (dihydrolipoamide acetyltransferase)